MSSSVSVIVYCLFSHHVFWGWLREDTFTINDLSLVVSTRQWLLIQTVWKFQRLSSYFNPFGHVLVEYNVDFVYHRDIFIMSFTSFSPVLYIILRVRVRVFISSVPRMYSAHTCVSSADDQFPHSIFHRPRCSCTKITNTNFSSPHFMFIIAFCFLSYFVHYNLTVKGSVLY